MLLKNKPPAIVLVGQPNVGKSAIMNYLTGVGAMVSNFPGTTVEVTEGRLHYEGQHWRVIDTPGTYTLHSDTEEQQVTQRILMEENIAILVNVVDAANLDRNLYLTLQLLDFNIPIVLVLNQIDRARSLGLKVDKQLLERFLGVPVIPVSAAKGEGLEELKEAIVKKGSRGITMGFSSQVEEVIGRLSASLSEIIPEERQNVGSHSIRTLAIHLLEHDRLDEELIRVYPGLDKLIEKLQQEMGEEHPLCPNCFRGCAFCPAYDQQHPIFLTCLERTAKARQIAQEVIQVAAHRKNTWAERIETVVDRPVTGIPILLATTYFSFKLVMLVIEETEAGISILVHLLGKWLAHWIVVPPSGIWNMLAKSFAEGAIIPFSVVMPAMVSVYTLIALLEDTGMLPRLAMSLDRFMRLFGLPGQSLISLILGFGCRAPAVLSTRILPQRRERLMVITLLGIVVPCAASLGIIAAVIAKFEANLLVIIFSMLLVFMILSMLLGRMLPGERMDLILEVPPLRLPILKNVLIKTWIRLESFFTQVLPLMLVMSLIIRVLLERGAFQCLGGISSLTSFFLGIPGEAFIGVVITVVQRYLAPMVLLNLPLSAREATIASTMVSLSFPCLPVSILILKELGLRGLLKILVLAGVVPVIVGLLLNMILPA